MIRRQGRRLHTVGPVRHHRPRHRACHRLRGHRRRLSRHFGPRHPGIRQPPQPALRLDERRPHPLGLLLRSRHRLQQPEHRRHQLYLHKRDEQTNHAHLSGRQAEFMPTQPEPNDHVRKADGISVVMTPSSPGPPDLEPYHAMWRHTLAEADRFFTALPELDGPVHGGTYCVRRAARSRRIRPSSSVISATAAPGSWTGPPANVPRWSGPSGRGRRSLWSMAGLPLWPRRGRRARPPRPRLGGRTPPGGAPVWRASQCQLACLLPHGCGFTVWWLRRQAACRSHPLGKGWGQRGTGSCTTGFFRLFERSRLTMTSRAFDCPMRINSARFGGR